MSNFHEILCNVACRCGSSPLTTLEYVMYFQFYGWQNVFTLCGSPIHGIATNTTQQDWRSASILLSIGLTVSITSAKWHSLRPAQDDGGSETSPFTQWGARVKSAMYHCTVVLSWNAMNETVNKSARRCNDVACSHSATLPLGPLCENMPSSIKPELHNVFQCRQRRTYSHGHG